MDNLTIHEQIDGLVQREKTLRDGMTGDAEADAERRREIKEISETLDQCWDLLRQRDAKMEFGENPNDAHVRSKSEVENYLD